MQQIHIKQVHYPSGIVRNFANGSKISAFTRQWILDHTANKSAVSINKRPSGLVEHGYTIEISDADTQALTVSGNLCGDAILLNTVHQRNVDNALNAQISFVEQIAKSMEK